MGDFFGVFFGLIWFFVIITSIIKISKNGKSISSQNKTVRPQQPQQSMQVPKTVRTSAPASAKKDTTQYSYGYGAFAPSKVKGKVSSKKQGTGIFENDVLLEDRRNDWLAKQLREEAAIKRRGSIYDLGASHDVNCDAEDNRLFHVKRHNTNGLNRRMFK